MEDSPSTWLPLRGDGRGWSFSTESLSNRVQVLSVNQVLFGYMSIYQFRG